VTRAAEAAAVLVATLASNAAEKYDEGWVATVLNCFFRRNCMDGLTLWLAADDLTTKSEGAPATFDEDRSDGSFIWEDRSPSQCHAVQDFFATAPTWNAYMGLRNGLPSLRFSKGAGLVGTGNIRVKTIVMVMKWDKPCDLAMAFSQSKNQDFSLRVSSDGGGQYRENGGDNNDWHHGQQNKLFVNGRRDHKAQFEKWTVVHAVKHTGKYPARTVPPFTTNATPNLSHTLSPFQQAGQRSRFATSSRANFRTDSSLGPWQRWWHTIGS
jgi:hypothetical protein